MRWDWSPPADWIRFKTIETHAAGEPLRIVVEGFPDLAGDSMLEKRRSAKRDFDGLRRALMWEPRGHADMYGCLPTDPVTPDGDIGVLFTHNEGFSTMCGHGVIALVKAGVECGLLAVPEDGRPIRLDTPAGRVEAWPCMRDERVDEVTFRNVPSFLLRGELPVEVPGLGLISCDIAFGGAFYAYVDAAQAGVDLTPESLNAIIDVARRISRAVSEKFPVIHPSGDPDLNFLYGTILVQMLEAPLRSRNVCVFADGEVDRSPTGTGVSGRAAIHWARGELAVGQLLEVESLIGSSFQVRAAESVEVGGFAAVVPEVSGRAYITGRSEFFIDPQDPFGEGFLLR